MAPSRSLKASHTTHVPKVVTAAQEDIFAGGGDMGGRMRAFDWSLTPLGDVSEWPQSLKTVVHVLLTSRFAMWMSWGPDLTFLYNDAYARMTLGKKHPWALGKPSREVWAEIWGDIGPRIRKVLATGEATWDEALLLFLERSGYREETYHTFSYSPLTGDDNRIAGHLCVVSEDTERVVGERRLATLRSLAAELSMTSTEEDVMSAISRSLGQNTRDLPFTLTYIFSDNGKHARLACGTGVDANHPAAQPMIDINSGNATWPIAELRLKSCIRVDNLGAVLGSLPTGSWQEPPKSALVAPIASQTQGLPAGFIIAALNPYRQLDASYSGFIDLIAGQIAGSLATARAYEQERKRAEALAELDRAKTTFFSNVSHEFRTPLTLMLGPTEDALASHDRALRGAELETVHRNELRLLKLVNTLLDFSRLEAGRVKAVYEPTDLATLTRELASVFRSAVERAGLAFRVETPPLSQNVYIDREMWEKIVLNLLSNALKSTFEGAITVRVRDAQDHVEVQVRDTGTGIPPTEVPHLFERFRRIEGARRRTHEGSGIGLALVHELVKLHGGSIQVESQLGKGTTFTVAIPFGSSHLPTEQVGSAGTRVVPASARAAFVQEALSWTDQENSPAYSGSAHADFDSVPSESASPSSARARVLVVDDNRDMREYLERLLNARFDVMTADNGRIACDLATREIPDLVLSDVMMPEMDGFQLLSTLRAQASTASLPVILLSARAGEESRVEGMEAGADDYLIKPFTARELLARVQGHIDIARFRREAFEREARLEQELDEARRQVSEAIEKMRDGFFMIDREWRFTYLNPAGERMATAVGASDAVVGTTLWQTFPDLLGTDIESHYRRCMQQRLAVDFEVSYARRNYHIRAYPVPNGGMVVYTADISARRKAELDVIKKQEHLTLLQQSAQIGQWELDIEEEELLVSSEFAAIAGLPPYVSRLRYNDFLQSLFFDTDRRTLDKEMERVLRGKKEFSVQLRLRRSDASVRLVTIRARSFFNQGRPVVLGVLIDITPSVMDGGKSTQATAARGKKRRSRPKSTPGHRS